MNEKEFWEHCGFKILKKAIWDGNVRKGMGRRGSYLRYVYPDGRKMSLLPQRTLDNLFKWAVPLLQDRGHCINIDCFECKGFKVSISDKVFRQDAMSGYDPYRTTIASAEFEDLKIALYEAIKKVFEDNSK